MKQYGIDPRLVIWIQRNTGRDLQTFSDLAKMKYLDSRKRNFSSAKKIEDVRLPSWLAVKDNDFSLIGEMTKLKQLSLHDVAIEDYSFLAKCVNLSELDLRDTDFSDCRLLAEVLRPVLAERLEYGFPPEPGLVPAGWILSYHSLHAETGIRLLGGRPDYLSLFQQTGGDAGDYMARGSLPVYGGTGDRTP